MVKVRFGLEQQGHIPTVEKMLSERKSWDEIAKVIGWVGYAVEEDYIRYLQRNNQQLRDRVEALQHALIFMCNTWSLIDEWAYSGKALDQYPVIQGTSQQIKLKQIGRKDWDNDKVRAGFKTLTESLGGEGD